MSVPVKIVHYLKNLLIILLMLLITFGGYVALITRNNNDMTIRQRVLKSVYPALIWWNKTTGRSNKVFANENPVQPPQSLYNLSVTLNNGETISLSAFKGKKLLLVNTASDCGFTDQYDEMQKLYEFPVK
jgi:glutathione peroxidase